MDCDLWQQSQSVLSRFQINSPTNIYLVKKKKNLEIYNCFHVKPMLGATLIVAQQSGLFLLFVNFQIYYLAILLIHRKRE